MTDQQMETHIKEASSSLEVEGLYMTDVEKDNLRKVLSGEFSFSDLVSRYVTDAKKLGRKYA
ncbi:hypothetical protein [Gordonibacter sp.]|uniref:hypothetical protein n=1 Tax=Gordonibacter sp. TaxID=1968902 RepID=UPI001F8F9450|nr:hypothetical protein [Gordonibacter sp.]HIW75057.1 hypothetical protein [Candidatus Gordonibacter avicola]